jgi:hypothetical protein
MLRDIQDEGYAGAIVFEWIDEWFKFTWNTIDYEQPDDRRQLWRSPLTNEENFGVIAAEPGRAPVVVVDGIGAEWDVRGHSPVVAETRGAVREVRVTHDPAYLYLRLRVDRARSWALSPIVLGFDVRPGGNRGLPGRGRVSPESDVAVTIGPGDRAKLVQAAWTDPIAFQYGVGRSYLAVDRDDLERGSGAWVEPRMILNKPYVVTTTRVRRPVEIVSIGELPWGTADPRSASFDSRTLVAGAGTVVELRLPWAMLTFADPSSRRVVVPRPDGSITTRRVGRTGIVVAAAGSEPVRTRGYAWEPWNRVEWHERRKAGWPLLSRAFRDAAARGVLAPR